MIGGGNVGLRIAKTLEVDENRIRSKIIERNRSQVELAASALEGQLYFMAMVWTRTVGGVNVSKTDAILL